jgi:protein phosphatase
MIDLPDSACFSKANIHGYEGVYGGCYGTHLVILQISKLMGDHHILALWEVSPTSMRLGARRLFFFAEPCPSPLPAMGLADGFISFGGLISTGLLLMDGFLGLIERAGDILTEEAAGRLEGLEREGALLVMDRSPTVVVGDIHGDLNALTTILRESGILRRIAGGWRLVFLGDYADRGPDSLGVYEAVLKLKLDHPSNVVLMRGNHEALEMIPFQPHDLPEQLMARHGSRGAEIYESLLALHPLLPSASIYGCRVLLIHGGVFQGISHSSLVRPSRKELEMMLWNDPFEGAEGTSPSPRGAGGRFGPSVTSEALRLLGVEHIVRSHSAVPGGHKFNHGGRVLTIFSSKNVYGLASGAYLVLEEGRSIGEGVRVF